MPATGQHARAWFLEIDLVRKVCVCVCVSVCPPPRLVITSAWCGMIWTPYDWLNKYYSFCMAAIVSIASRHGLRIEMCCRNQSKLALYNPLLCLYSLLKQPYISNKTKHFSYKGRCGVRGVHISRHLKEELAWATYKRLLFISNIMLFKTVIPLRN